MRDPMPSHCLEISTQVQGHWHRRIVDESEDRYLYPAKRFFPAELPLARRRAVLRAA